MLEHQQQITILDRLYGVITSPVPTLRSIARDQLYVWGALILLTSSLVAEFLLPTDPEVLDTLPPVFGEPNSFRSLIIGIIGFVVYSLLLHVVAKLFGGAGTWLGFIAAIGFASFPAFFRLPLLLLQSTPLSPIAGAALILVSLWILVLNVIATKESYSLTAGKAIGALIVAALVAGLVLGAVFISSILANPDGAEQLAAVLDTL